MEAINFPHNNRAQGMPMEFIVIAVMVILVLVVVTMVFLQGSAGTSAIDMQTVANNCDSECLFAVQYTKTITKTDLASSTRTFGFCSKSFVVKGMSGTQKCENLVNCNLIFTDGSGCKAICDANKLKCSP